MENTVDALCLLQDFLTGKIQSIPEESKSLILNHIVSLEEQNVSQRRLINAVLQHNKINYGLCEKCFKERKHAFYSIRKGYQMCDNCYMKK